MLAGPIQQVLYAGKPEENKSALVTIAWIVEILTIGILAYLFINEKNWEGVINRIKKFFAREVIDKGDKGS